ncbi:Uncharacterized protein SCF082_LOCUS34758 [Durusdinium trenchii]|uniref:Uncharacterized protein n=1 Tax=Durusdinium trenchii TaxID=1381693 RepID=A0ABP0P3F3_9DINO
MVALLALASVAPSVAVDDTEDAEDAASAVDASRRIVGRHVFRRAPREPPAISKSLGTSIQSSVVSRRSVAAPLSLWASIREKKPEVKPTYASMAGDDPASGKNWSSKPKQQVNAWNRTMQHTYHTYIPSSYQKLPSKAADIRASSAASKNEQKFKGYSDQYGGLAKVAMSGAKKDFHQRSHSSNGAQIPDLHEYADRYASKENSHDASYESYLKDYGGTEQGQDGAKYMTGGPRGPASGGSSEFSGSSIPDYQHFMDDDAFSKDDAFSSEKARSSKSGEMSYQKYMGRASSDSGTYQKYLRGGSSHWSKQYGHSSGWKNQLSGVVPSFVPRFNAEPAERPTGYPADGVNAELLSEDGQCWWWGLLALVPLGSITLAKAR